MNLRIYQIAEKFEKQCKDAGRIDEENLEDLSINLPAEDIYYMLSILLSPETMNKNNLIWGEANGIGQSNG